MPALDIVDRLNLLARGDNLDLADIVCADAVAEIERLRTALDDWKQLADKLEAAHRRVVALAGTPVIWRCRCGQQNLWSYGTEEEVDWFIKQAGVKQFEKEPLFVSLPLTTPN